MTGWRVVFTPDAETDFQKLDKQMRLRIKNRLAWLQANFEKFTPTPLHGEWKDYFKLRIGGWRVIYKLDWDNNLIIIYVIDRRDKIYKKN